MHVRLVLEGGLASLHGMVWATCMCGIGVMALLVVLLVASEYAISFPMMHLCTRTFWMVMLWRNHVMCCTMDAISSLYGWLCWEDGLLM